MNVLVYEKRYPWIKWREPVKLNGRLACRVCLGSHGIPESEIATSSFCFDTLRGFREHFAAHHMPKAGG